jgi:hypothetical protein
VRPSPCCNAHGSADTAAELGVGVARRPCRVHCGGRTGWAVTHHRFALPDGVPDRGHDDRTLLGADRVLVRSLRLPFGAREKAVGIAVVTAIGSTAAALTPALLGWIRVETGSLSLGLQISAGIITLGGLVLLIGVPARVLRESHQPKQGPGIRQRSTRLETSATQP